MKVNLLPVSALLAIICLSLIVAIPAFAETNKLDSLFTELKQAKDETEARSLEDQIWKTWLSAENDEIDALMQQAVRQRRNYDFIGALETLNKVIALTPDYAEAWNQRATVYFHQQEFEKSLEDIAKTLELEPRHFGSLAGRAVIRLMQSKPALARQSIIEALKHHPFLKERSMFPGL